MQYERKAQKSVLIPEQNIYLKDVLLYYNYQAIKLNKPPKMSKSGVNTMCKSIEIEIDIYIYLSLDKIQ